MIILYNHKKLYDFIYHINHIYHFDNDAKIRLICGHGNVSSGLPKNFLPKKFGVVHIDCVPRCT